MRLIKGTTVTIQFGPFANFKGMVTSVLGRRVVVHIALDKRPVLVELDRDMVELAKVTPK